MSYRNKFGNKTDSSRKESSFGNKDKSDYSSYSNRFDALDQIESNSDSRTSSRREDSRTSSKTSSRKENLKSSIRREDPKTSSRKEDSRSSSRKEDLRTSLRREDLRSSSKYFEDDDGFKPVRKTHYNSEKRYNRQDRNRSSESYSYSSHRSSKTESTTSSDEPIEKKELSKSVFTINGPGYFKRKSMVDKINNGIKMSTVIDITRLYNEASPDIQRFIKQTEIEELNIIIWNYINEQETAHIHIGFDEHECDFMNPSEEDKPADLLISKSKFMSMMAKMLFYQNCFDFISNSITINLPEYTSKKQEQINHFGIIGFAIHNDTPDSGIKIYELFHVIVYNMLNLFVQGYAGKAYCFKISPQGNRFNIELRYDLDEFEDVQDVIKHIRLIATSYYNKIFSHLICYGCKQPDQRKPFMKYSFDGYVSRKKTTEETETKEEVKKEDDE